MTNDDVRRELAAMTDDQLLQALAWALLGPRLQRRHEALEDEAPQ